MTVLLLVPFAAKTIDPKLEPFPSPVFPSNPSLIRLKQDFEFTVTELYGYDSTIKTLVKLNNRYFLKEIPVHYLPVLAKENFGLKYFDSLTIKINRLNLHYIKYSKITEKEIEDTKIWLQKGLREQKCKDSLIMVIKRKFVVNKNSKNIISNIILDEQQISLY